jgi:hypothetical protein
MATITVETGKYTRTHGRTPRQTQAAAQGRGLWAFALDAEERVIVKYGAYQEALDWAKAQATSSVEVLP